MAEGKPAGREEAPKRSATRIWLVAATITATLLAAVGTVAYYRYAAALARIEDQYSRRAAHLAEEVDLRIESYQRVAEVLGNVIERVQERLTTDQIVSVAASRGGSPEEDPQVKAARELKDSASKARQAAPAVTDERIKAAPAESSTVDIDVQAQCRAPFRAANWRHRDDDGLWPFCETLLSKPGTEKPGSPWSLSFWANTRGQEQIQFYAGERGIPPVNVGNRRYFREALDACAVSKVALGQRVVPEVTRSMTRAQKVMIIARATCAVDPKEGESGVAVVVHDVKAFTRLAPVPGTQWAIIDDEGTVMLHSNLEEHHGHNIFEDLDPSTRQRVASAMVARARESFDGDFRGARSRFHVRSEASSGWYVVGIGSRGHDDAVLRNTLLTTLVAVALFVLALALVIIPLGFYRRAQRLTIALPEDSLVDPKLDEARLRQVEAAAAAPNTVIVAECDPLRHCPPGSRARWRSFRSSPVRAPRKCIPSRRTRRISPETGMLPTKTNSACWRGSRSTATSALTPATLPCCITSCGAAWSTPTP